MASVQGEFDIAVEFMVDEDGNRLYRCPYATWKPKGDSEWRGSTSSWTSVDDLMAALETELRPKTS